MVNLGMVYIPENVHQALAIEANKCHLPLNDTIAMLLTSALKLDPDEELLSYLAKITFEPNLGIMSYSGSKWRIWKNAVSRVYITSSKYLTYDIEKCDHNDETTEKHWGLSPVAIAALVQGFVIALNNEPKMTSKKSVKVRCHASRDGECIWDQCPQTRDNEPHATGRHCPIDTRLEEEREEI